MYPYLVKQAKFQDRHVKKWSEQIHHWDGTEQISGAALLGAPLGKTSISHSGAHLSPQTIRQMLDAYATYHATSGQDIAGLYDCGDVQMHVTDLQTCQERIYETVAALSEKNPHMIPIILGGDHSISFPSIRGFAKSRGRVGVIQFDAHHDVRNLEDGGPSNGTPFRSLLDGGYIKGEDLIQIGIRNFSNARAYHAYTKEQGIHVYDMKAVRKRGIEAIIEESLAILRTRVDAIYISVDMDVLDQAFAPGCPAIGPGGMDSTGLLEAIELLASDPLVRAMDIVEIDPTLDFRHMTSRIAAHLIMEFVTARQLNIV